MNMALNELSNVEFYWAGVGDHIDQIELAPEMPINTTGEPINEGVVSLSGGSGQFVPLISIDSLQLEKVALIKIDVEGMEDDVIDGAGALFQKFSDQFRRQSCSNQRSQIDSYCLNTDQFTKPAVVDFSALSRSKLSQKLFKQSTRQTLLKNRPIIFIEIQGGGDFELATNEQHRRIQTTIDKLNALHYDVFLIETHNYLAIPQGRSSNFY